MPSYSFSTTPSGQPTSSRGQNLPEEVVLAENLRVPNEAFVAEDIVALGAFEALRVPAFVQDFEDETVHDEMAATGTFRNRG